MWAGGGYGGITHVGLGGMRWGRGGKHFDPPGLRVLLLLLHSRSSPGDTLPLSPQEPVKSPGNKYTKIFSKMWAGRDSADSSSGLTVQQSAGSANMKSMSAAQLAPSRSKSVGKGHLGAAAAMAAAGYHDDLQRVLSRDSSTKSSTGPSRQDSMTQMRAPDVRMRHLANNAGGVQDASPLGASRVLVNKNLPAPGDLSPTGRVNSESTLTRPAHSGAVRNSSFTVEPEAAKRLALGAVATKVTEYHQAGTSSRAGLSSQ